MICGCSSSSLNFCILSDIDSAARNATQILAYRSLAMALVLSTERDLAPLASLVLSCKHFFWYSCQV